MMEGIRVRPATLADARDHVLMSLGLDTDANEAESRATALTLAYLGRVRGEPVRRIAINSTADVHVHLGWRGALAPVLDPVADTVLRLHYGDGMNMEAVESAAAIDVYTLMASTEGLRSVVRDIAIKEGYPADTWPDSRIDMLISRVANLPEPQCPPPMDILSEHNRVHADGCPRCSRCVRMIRGGILAVFDLLPSSEGETGNQVVVGAVLLHPDARRSRRKIERALGATAVNAGPDVWVLSKDELSAAGPALRALVSEGVIPRHHLRGAVVRGRGRWSGQVLLGPTAVEAIESARSRPWAEVDTLGELPPPRPKPPGALRWWVAAVTILAFAVGVGVSTLSEQPPSHDVPIEASFVQAEDGWEITFDVSDLAVVDIVTVGEDGPRLLHASVRAELGQWATSGGDYRVYVPEKTVALLASVDGVEGLAAWVKQSPVSPTPWVALDAWLRANHPTVAWVGAPEISPVEIELAQPEAPAASNPE
jgi:hypothetical protein